MCVKVIKVVVDVSFADSSDSTLAHTSNVFACFAIDNTMQVL